MQRWGVRAEAGRTLCPVGATPHAETEAAMQALDQWVERGEGKWPQWG